MQVPLSSKEKEEEKEVRVGKRRKKITGPKLQIDPEEEKSDGSLLHSFCEEGSLQFDLQTFIKIYSLNSNTGSESFSPVLCGHKNILLFWTFPFHPGHCTCDNIAVITPVRGY